MTRLLQSLPCPQCGSRTVSYCKRRDNEFKTEKIGRYRRCVVCHCRFGSVVENGVERVDKIVDDGNSFEVALLEVDFSTTEKQDGLDDIPEPNQAWQSVKQMRKGLILSIYLDLLTVGEITDETKELSTQISIAKEN